MKVIGVDDEYHALKALERAIKEALPQCEFCGFQNPEEALDFAKHTPIDIAFLDLEMRTMHGLILAKKLKDIYGLTNIIFVTGYSEYAMDAFQLRASGYIMKPVQISDIKIEVENLRHIPKENEKAVVIKTFGNFEVQVNGKPVIFSRSKSKEILAYLVDRGGTGITVRELASALWEDRDYTRSIQQQIQTYITALIGDLKKVGASDVIIRKRNFLAIDVEKISCDLYSYQRGDIHAVNGYRGEYMANYSWGEFTAALLDNKHRNY